MESCGSVRRKLCVSRTPRPLALYRHYPRRRAADDRRLRCCHAPTARVFGGTLASRAARQSPAAPPVVVGSKLDLEGGLLGEMMLLALWPGQYRDGKPAADRADLDFAGGAFVRRHRSLRGIYRQCRLLSSMKKGDPVWKDAGGRLCPRRETRLRKKPACLADARAGRQ